MISIIPIFCFCVSLSFGIEKPKTYDARVTYYWTGNQTAIGVKPKQGVTIAVDKKIIPYNSKVYIPLMHETFIAQDTGPDVISKKAARKMGRKNAIVVDVYCKNKAEANKMIKKYPHFMKVVVYP